MKKMDFKKLLAFTMAEAILVMTILGIIATIMISTLKPAEFKDKALQIMAKKVMGEIDNATTLIMTSPSGGNIETWDPNAPYLYHDWPSLIDCASAISYPGCWSELINEYKDKLTTIRKDVASYNAMSYPNITSSIYGWGLHEYKTGYDWWGFFLKDGVFMLIFPPSGDVQTIFPGENNTTNLAADYIIYFDTNGNEEPNVLGKDQFVIPLNKSGIVYGN